MRANGVALKISRILHAGYLFQSDQAQIAFDPIFENPFSRNCYAFPKVHFDYKQIKDLKLDAVFISHFHDDHCSLESLNYLDRNTPIYMYCLFGEIFSWIQELGFSQVHSLKLDDTVKVGDFEITPRRALDTEVDSLFQIQAGDLKILNVVDSWIDEAMLDQLLGWGPWDLILWPFQTMREIEVLAPTQFQFANAELPPEWLVQLKKLSPKYIVPSSCQFIHESWSWYNQALFPISYRQFQLQIESELPSCQVIRLNPSVTATLDKNKLQLQGSLSWIQPVGEQDVDYDYKKDIQPPQTSEIAKNFAAMTQQQMERITDYCRNKLLLKYKSLDLSFEDYFSKSLVWRLSIYDHNGVPEHYHYHIQGRGIELTSDTDKPLAWTTEIPASKLYAALEYGESLTSMYMRINDHDFDENVENEIQSVDIIEDPLIRCLFTGVFGSYQKAQLEKLRQENKNVVL